MAKPENIAIGRRLRAAREARGMKAVDLARAAGITKQPSTQMLRFETGVRGISPRLLATFAEILDVRVEALLRDGNEPVALVPQTRPVLMLEDSSDRSEDLDIYLRARGFERGTARWDDVLARVRAAAGLAGPTLRLAEQIVDLFILGERAKPESGPQDQAPPPSELASKGIIVQRRKPTKR